MDYKQMKRFPTNQFRTVKIKTPMKYSLVRIKIRQYKYQRGCRTKNINILRGRKYINTIAFAKVSGII